jgi:RimJ/RimL family protein N-acetyltransferase
MAIAFRSFEMSDGPALHQMFNHPQLVGKRYIDQDRGFLSEQQVEELLGKWTKPDKETRLAVCSEDRLIGTGVIDPSWEPLAPFVAVVIDPGHQRHGYGTEALNHLLEVLFGTGPALAAETWVDEWNGPGLAFASAAGFTEAGRARREGIYHGRYFSSVALDLLREEWEADSGH